MESIPLLGVQVHPVTVPELHHYIACIVATRRKAQILNVNVHALNLAHENHAYRAHLNRADLVFCDGAGVMLAARLLGYRIPHRITYADWMWQLAAYAEPRNLSFFFLGAKPGIADKAACALKQRFPCLRIAGTRHGYFDHATGAPENENVIQHINAVQPDILVVGLGMPLQEEWLAANWARLDVRIALTGGAVFDYLSGELQRGPALLTEHGLEWLTRLIIEPRRLWKRYLLGNPLFAWRVLRYAVANETRRTS